MVIASSGSLSSLSIDRICESRLITGQFSPLRSYP